jgi:hypothetical protein
MKQFKELFATALSNLCENKPSTDPFIKRVVEQSTGTADSADWLITDENIADEIDRNEGMNVSFNFALCWLRTERTEILQMKQQGKRSYQNNRLLSKIIGLETTESDLTSGDQLLATNYFQFLEANGFLKCDKDFLYGDLLQSTPPSFEEPILILL